MKIIKDIIESLRNNALQRKAKPLGKSVSELYDLMDKNPSLINPLQAMNPSMVFLQKLQHNDDKDHNTFILKLKVKDDMFQLDFPVVFVRSYDGDYNSYHQAQISVLSSPHVVKISDNLVPNFLKELDVEGLVTKSINDLNKLKESQDLEILNKIKVRP